MGSFGWPFGGRDLELRRDQPLYLGEKEQNVTEMKLSQIGTKMNHASDF